MEAVMWFAGGVLSVVCVLAIAYKVWRIRQGWW